MFILTLLTLECCSQTTAQKEFRSKNEIDRLIYNQDKDYTSHLLMSEAFLTKFMKKPIQKYLGVIIDTIFYGGENKFALLAIYEQKYINSKNIEQISYRGLCFIGFKKGQDDIIIEDKIKYISSDQSPMKVTSMLRDIYLKELGLIENRFSINDVRFWDSKIWDIE